jgi:hypothetical protein
MTACRVNADFSNNSKHAAVQIAFAIILSALFGPGNHPKRRRLVLRAFIVCFIK